MSDRMFVNTTQITEVLLLPFQTFLTHYCVYLDIHILLSAQATYNTIFSPPLYHLNNHARQLRLSQGYPMTFHCSVSSSISCWFCVTVFPFFPEKIKEINMNLRKNVYSYITAKLKTHVMLLLWFFLTPTA